MGLREKEVRVVKNVFEYNKKKGWVIGPGAVSLVRAVLWFILLYSGRAVLPAILKSHWLESLLSRLSTYVQ